MHSNRSEHIDSISAGDIAVIVGLKNAQTGDTIGSESFQILLERMLFPEPVISVAVEPKTLSDMDKLKKVLKTLENEDPTFFVKEDADTGQIIISGMGELHLDVLVTRIIDDYNVSANVGNPQVTYRESITKTITHREKFHKVLAGKENSAEIILKVEPLPRGTGTTFTVDMKNREGPDNCIQTVRRGVTGSFTSGILFGYPAYDIGVTLLDAVYNPNTGTEFSFEAAAAHGFDNACRQASPVLLEPIMKLDVMVPKEYVGDVLSRLTSRGSVIISLESRTTIEHIQAESSMVNMFGYATALRSMTQGRGTFSMEFSHFAKKKESKTR